jgi:hypothetical protein
MSGPTLAGFVQGSRAQRISLDALREAFAKERPELASSGTFRERLRACLDELASAGLIRLPAANGSAWDKVGAPSLPKWVQRPREVAPTRIDRDAIAWLPVMAFARKLKRRSDIEAASAINQFLVRNRHALQAVPLRERSLQIFGDEKALDGRCRNGALFSGQLSLDAIGAFDPAPPLPYEAIEARGLPLLLLENHHTYWSFSSWNSQARKYAAVVYGAGWAISRCGPALATVMRQTGGRGVVYFGDIDPAGIRIALKLAAQIETAQLPTLQPAEELYARAFRDGVRRPLGRTPSRSQLEEAKTWLPASLHADIERLYTAGQRIPQESVGLDVLRKWPR